MTTPRGIRNRNPGNIDFNPRNDRVGQLGLEEGVAKPRFARENDTQAYARAVTTWISVHPTSPIDIKNPAMLRGMVVGISVHENGGNSYSAAVIDEGVRRALA